MAEIDEMIQFLDTNMRLDVKSVALHQILSNESQVLTVKFSLSRAYFCWI